MILIGTASWTDPGFIADWYPRSLPAPDRLAYYAERFHLVEVNSSFYAIPDRRTVQRWCDQTPPGFVFDVKLHRLLSRHSTTLPMLPLPLRSGAETKGDKVILTPPLEKAVARELLRQLLPLSESGKLGALLLQLTPSFGPDRHSLGELDSLFELLSGHRIAVELRNRHWVMEGRLEETAAFFRKREITLVALDGPEGEHFMTMPRLDVVTQPRLAYLRLHGRNLQGYLSGKSVAERFNYSYSDDELAGIAGRVVKLSREAAETHVIYNNNASDYPLRNAAAFQQLLARAYPDRKVVTPPPRVLPGIARTLELDFGPTPSRPSRPPSDS